MALVIIGGHKLVYLDLNYGCIEINFLLSPVHSIFRRLGEKGSRLHQANSTRNIYIKKTKNDACSIKLKICFMEKITVIIAGSSMTSVAMNRSRRT
jgi:hypothetical protein